jgi:hypothetical protein
MKYLKFLALLCAVTVSGAILSACSDNSTPPASSPAPAPEVVKPNS